MGGPTMGKSGMWNPFETSVDENLDSEWLIPNPKNDETWLAPLFNDVIDCFYSVLEKNTTTAMQLIAMVPQAQHPRSSRPYILAYHGRALLRIQP